MPFVLPIALIRREVRATLVLAVPLALTQLAQIGMSFVDVVMIGRLGPAAMAGGVVGSAVFFSLALVSIGVIVAVNPTVSQAVGAGDEAAVGRAARSGLWLATLLGVPLVVLLGFAEPLLLATGQEPETARLAGVFLGAIRWGLLPDLWFTALRGLCEGLSRPRPVLVFVLAAAGLNAFGNWVLMYGNLGAPALGLAGSGWSTSLAMTAMAVGLGLYVHFAPSLRRHRVFAGLARPEGPAMRALFRLGWPIGIALGLEAGLFGVSTLLVGRFGAGALAAHQVALNAASVTFMVPLGIGMAASVRVGQATGAGDRAGAARAGFTGIGMGATFMLLSALLFWLRPAWVVWVYTGSNADPAVAEAAVGLLFIAAVFQLFDGTQTTAAGALRGLKDTRAPMLVAAVAYWAVGLPAALALGFGAGWGARGIWWGLTLGLAVAAVLLTLRFRRRVRAEGTAVPAVLTERR